MELREMAYEQYLKTDYWKKLSEKIKKKSGFKCQLCNKENNLNVHHRSYENRGYEELEEKDLLCLCEKCHKIFHESEKIKPELNQAIIDIFKKYGEALKIEDENINTLFGFKDLDSFMGVNYGELIILSGVRECYSDFIINIFLKKFNKDSIMINLNSSKEMLLKKVLTIGSVTPFQRVDKGYLTDEDYGKLGLFAAEISDEREMYSDLYSLEGIETLIKTYHKTHKKYFVDSINFIEKSGQIKNSYNEITQIIIELKKIAKKYNVIIFANFDFPQNELLKRVDRRVYISDIEKFGNFSSVTENILCFYRDDYYDLASEDKGLCEVLLSTPVFKGNIKLRYFHELLKYLDL